MAQTPRELTPDQSALHLFGAELRYWREHAEISQARLAERIHFTADLIAKIERAERWPRDDFARVCDEALRTGGVLARMWPLVEREHLQHTSNEDKSTAPVPVSPGSVVHSSDRRGPGDPSDRLTNDIHPSRSEWWPVTRYGGAGSTANGVDPNLVAHWTGLLRVLAASNNAFGARLVHDAVRREITVIHRYRREATGLVRTQLLGVEARWAEFASWTAENLGDRHESAYWLCHSAMLADEAADPAMFAYVTMRRAQQAAERRDASSATALADHANHFTELGARDRALCAVRMAQGHALDADDRLCLAAIDDAFHFVAHADETGADDDPATIGRHCTHRYVQAHQGFCCLQLGKPHQAISTLESALDRWPSQYRQDEGLARVWLALSYADAGRHDEAAAEGTRALNVTAGATRAVRALGALNATLPNDPAQELSHFRAAYTATAAANMM